MWFKGGGKEVRNFAPWKSPWGWLPQQWWSPAAGLTLGGSLSQLLFCSMSLTKSTQTTIVWLAHAPTGRWWDNHALLFPSHNAVISENTAELQWRITRFYSVSTPWWIGELLSASNTLQACDPPWSDSDDNQEWKLKILEERDLNEVILYASTVR